MKETVSTTRLPPSTPLLLIPARMASARLPGKVLADICGRPMILHVWQRALEAKLGDVVVAAAEQEIVDVVIAAGGNAVLTDPQLPTGSDRIYQALQKIDPEKKFDAIINVQGDEPLQEPANIQRVFQLLQNPLVDIGTCVAPLTDKERLVAPQVVKAALNYDDATRQGQCLYFSRAPIPAGEGPHFHHIGLYAYRREALEQFVKSPQSWLEKRESLEQLRALSLGMRIDAALVDVMAMGVDTPADLEMARAMLAARQKK